MQKRKTACIGRATSNRLSLDGAAAAEVTVTVALRKHIRRLQQSLDQKVNSLSRGVTPERVHKTRTAARRLRSVLRAFRRELNAPAFHQYASALQQLAHDLDAVREADVTQQAISILSKGHTGVGREGLDGLKSAVSRSRLRTVLDLESAMGADSWTARLAKLRYVASDPGLIVETQEPMSSITQRVLRRRRHRLRAALRYPGHAPLPLHKLRLKVKTLRYLLEQCESAHSGVARAEVTQLHELQDCLGGLHDAWCLRRMLKRQWRYRRATNELLADIKTRQMELLHRFQKHRKALRRIWCALRNTNQTPIGHIPRAARGILHRRGPRTRLFELSGRGTSRTTRWRLRIGLLRNRNLSPMLVDQRLH
jgi:CHAD domain-containing protein